MTEDKNKNDDFFNLLAQDEKVTNPFGQDEILFLDEDGQLKVLKEGKVSVFDQPKETPDQLVEKKNLKEPVRPKVPPSNIGLAQTAQPASGQLEKIDQQLKNIFKKSGIHFTDPVIENRFRNIVISRLKEVRDQIQTREALTNQIENGGLGFSLLEAEKVLMIINQELAVTTNEVVPEFIPDQPSKIKPILPVADSVKSGFTSQVIKASADNLQAEVDSLLVESLKKDTLPVKPKLKEEIEPKVVKPELSKPITQTTPTLQISDKLNQPDQPVVKPVVAEKKLLPVEQKKVSNPSLTEQKNNRPVIEDIKFKPKLTGPIEEIKSMTLEDFRKLAKTPKEATEKIITKIEILEREAFSKRLEAIKAWKQNEISQLYLGLGDQSMEEKKPIYEIIQERQQAGQPTLSQEELESVIELNRKLRY